MSDHLEAIPLGPDDIDAELAEIKAEPLRVQALDPRTGVLVEGTIYREHLAAAIVERGVLKR